MKFKEINPSPRTLMTLGPVEADPRVLRAMSAHILGNQARILGNSIAEMKASIFVHICTPFLKNKNMFEKLLTM